MECEYGRYSPELRSDLRAMAGRLGLAVTGGSDYHGDRETYAQAHAQLWVPPLVEGPLRVAIADAAARVAA